MGKSKYSHNKITITGDLGSGKSAVSKLLQQEFGYEIYSTGKVQREIALRYGMSTLELNQYAETHPEIDEEIDSVFVKLNDSPDGFIVDSRLAWFFMPDSFKIYLTVPFEIAAKRIMSDPHRKGEKYKDIEHAVQDISARKGSENIRFLEKYGADLTKMDNFNLVVDTSDLLPDEVASRIIAKFREWQAAEK